MTVQLTLPAGSLATTLNPSVATATTSLTQTTVLSVQCIPVGSLVLQVQLL